MPYKDIDNYIAAFPVDIQVLLKKVRATVKRAAPEATEIISYQMPSFKLNGHLVYFGAFKKHIGFFPPVRGQALKKAAAVYAGEKGNLRFPYAEPIPYGLIARIVKARVKEDKRHAAARKAKSKKSRNR